MILLPAALLASMPLVAASPVQSVDVAGVHVALTPSMAVERPTRLPVRVEATSMPTTRAPPPPGFARPGDTVVVELCQSLQCTIAERVTVVVDGAPVDVEGPVWPGGVQARVVVKGAAAETHGDTLSAAHVVANLRPGAASRWLYLGDGARIDGGVVETAITPAFARAHPTALDAVGGVIAGTGDVDLTALRAVLAAGGVVVATDTNLFDALTAAAAAPPTTPLDAAPRIIRGSATSAPLGTLEVPSGAALARVGPGVLVRLPGAGDSGALAAALAADPDLAAWRQRANPDDNAAVRVGAVAVAKRPARDLAFPLALAGVVGVAAVVWRGRRRRAPVGAVLARAAGVSAASTAALFALGFATAPVEQHAHVVLWTGADASFEMGADVVRPSRTARVEVHGDAPLVGVAFPGSRREPAGADAVYFGRDASAVIPSNIALAGTWTRRVTTTRAVRVERNRVINTLGARFDVVQFRTAKGDEERVVFDLPAGGAADAADASALAWDRGAQARMSALDVAERRAVNEIIAMCRPRAAACGAAVTRLPDGTIFGVEVTQ